MDANTLSPELPPRKEQPVIMTRLLAGSTTAEPGLGGPPPEVTGQVEDRSHRATSGSRCGHGVYGNLRRACWCVLGGEF